jgi:hypothetical protein
MPGTAAGPRKGDAEVDQAFPELLPGLLRPARARQARPPLAAGEWAALIAHPPTRARYEARVHRRGPDDCWYWLGAISDTGHGKLRAGSRAAGAAEAGEPPSRVVTSHALGYRIAYGESPGALLIAHRCDGRARSHTSTRPPPTVTTRPSGSTATAPAGVFSPHALEQTNPPGFRP